MKLKTCQIAVPDVEADHRAERAPLQRPRGEGVLRMGSQARIVDVAHSRVIGRHTATWLAFIALALHPQRQRLDLAQHQPHASCGARFARPACHLVRLTAAGHAGHDHTAQHVAVAARYFGRAVYDVIPRPAPTAGTDTATTNVLSTIRRRRLRALARPPRADRRPSTAGSRSSRRSAAAPARRRAERAAAAGLDRGRIGRAPRRPRGHALARQQPAQQHA